MGLPGVSLSATTLRLLGASVCVSLLVLVGIATPSALLAQTKIQGAVDQQIADKGRARVIIKTRPDPDILNGGPSMYAPYAYIAGTLNVSTTEVRQIPAIPAVVTTITKSDLERLRSDPNVEAVYADLLVPPTTNVTINLIGADKVHAKGFLGTSWTVAVLDTGIDATHPALQSALAGEACFSTPKNRDPLATTLCPNGDAVDLMPGSAGNCPASIHSCVHGTHVAGIVAGRATTFNGITYEGVSPSARILAVQVFTRFDDAATCQGPPPCVLSYTSDQLAALGWLFRNKEKFKVASVNMSLGAGYFDQPCDKTNPLTEVIDRLRSSGVLTVISAGNDSYFDGVSSPACISSAVTVAASTKAGPIDTSYSNVSPYVDIVAPGSDVVSSVFGHGYGPLSGTSMAAPHVSGAIALLREEFPNATADEIENRLKKGSPTLVDNRTGTSLPALEVAHTLPASGAPVAVAAAAPAAAPPSTGRFIIKTVASPQQVANSVNSTCGQNCALQRISEDAWRLDVPPTSALAKGKSTLGPDDLKALKNALPVDAKIYSNVLSAPH